MLFNLLLSLNCRALSNDFNVKSKHLVRASIFKLHNLSSLVSDDIGAKSLECRPEINSSYAGFKAAIG